MRTALAIVDDTDEIKVRPVEKSLAMTSNHEHRGRPTCTALRKDGRLCRAKASGDPPLCVGHSATAKEGRQKGGRNRATKERIIKRLPADLRHLAEDMEAARKKVATGDFSPSQGTAIAALARATLSIYEFDALQLLGQLEQAIKRENDGPYER